MLQRIAVLGGGFAARYGSAGKQDLGRAEMAVEAHRTGSQGECDDADEHIACTSQGAVDQMSPALPASPAHGNFGIRTRRQSVLDK